MNKVLLTGNICKDIELKQTSNGRAVVSNTVVIRNDFKTNGEYGTTFVNFIAWGVQADFLKKYAKKGDRIELVGRWQNRTYEKDNKKHTVSECVIETLNIINRKEKVQDSGIVPVNDENLPF